MFFSKIAEDDDWDHIYWDMDVKNAIFKTVWKEVLSLRHISPVLLNIRQDWGAGHEKPVFFDTILKKIDLAL